MPINSHAAFCVRTRPDARRSIAFATFFEMRGSLAGFCSISVGSVSVMVISRHNATLVNGQFRIVLIELPTHLIPRAVISRLAFRMLLRRAFPRAQRQRSRGDGRRPK